MAVWRRFAGLCMPEAKKSILDDYHSSVSFKEISCASYICMSMHMPFPINISTDPLMKNMGYV